MDKSAAQRMQAILALMIGAFTFGCYITYHEATIAANKSVNDQQIRIYIDREKVQNGLISTLTERVIRLELIENIK